MSGRTNFVFGWMLALVGMAVFARLGVWQLGRMDDKQAMLDASAVVLRERHALPLSAASDPQRAGGYDWAAGEGAFANAPLVLLDNQERNGHAGIRAYRIFQPAVGGAPLLLELGWLPLPGDRRMPPVPRPFGSLYVVGLLAPPPSAGIMNAGVVRDKDGSVLTVALDMPSLRHTLHMPRLAARVLRLDPAQPLGYARDLDILPNTLSPQRHLGYAVQWFALALTVLVTALVLSLRKKRTTFGTNR